MSLEKPLPDPTEKQLADWKTTREQRAFFDQIMKNQVSSLLKASTNDYPEVTVERFSPSQHKISPVKQ